MANAEQSTVSRKKYNNERFNVFGFYGENVWDICLMSE